MPDQLLNDCCILFSNFQNQKRFKTFNRPTGNHVEDTIDRSKSYTTLITPLNWNLPHLFQWSTNDLPPFAKIPSDSNNPNLPAPLIQDQTGLLVQLQIAMQLSRLAHSKPVIIRPVNAHQTNAMVNFNHVSDN